MYLDLREIIHTPGESREFHYELDLSQVELYGEKPFDRPIAISGTVRNMAGALELTGMARSVLDTRCDRCLRDIAVELSVPVKTLLAEDAFQRRATRRGTTSSCWITAR